MYQVAHYLRSQIGQSFYALGPGVLSAVMVAIASQFLSDHYGAPAMLLALLLGIAFNFLSEGGKTVEGVGFTAKSVLRFGVALLGARISVDLLISLGPWVIALVISALIVTIAFGLFVARFFGQGWRFALLTGGSVAICGASAAMANAAVLPKNEYSERNLLFTVLGVTVLSTIAMIAYPIVTQAFGMDEQAAGIFIGATIHDVAQVVGAGFSISEPAGETATLVKLIRVSMLAPVVLCLALSMRALNLETTQDGARPPLVPSFVLGFLALATLNSLALIPQEIGSVLNDLSRWALLSAIAAVGMKTALKRVFDVGAMAVALIVVETLFIGGFVLGGLTFMN